MLYNVSIYRNHEWNLLAKNVSLAEAESLKAECLAQHIAVIIRAAPDNA